jgi:hypothetical protein
MADSMREEVQRTIADLDHQMEVLQIRRDALQGLLKGSGSRGPGRPAGKGLAKAPRKAAKTGKRRSTESRIDDVLKVMGTDSKKEWQAKEIRKKLPGITGNYLSVVLKAAAAQKKLKHNGKPKAGRRYTLA